MSALGMSVALAAASIASWAAGRASTAAQRRTLQWRATHDPLTGLYNRAGLDAEARRALAAGGPAVALLVDLDDFKAVNDTHGHAAGDDVIRQAAARLRDHLGHTGVLIGRRGGDEFAVVLPALDLTDSTARRRAAHIADAVHRMLTAEYRLHPDPESPAPCASATATATVGASVGAAVGRGDRPLSLGELLTAADDAMYAAKRRGGGWSFRSAGAGPDPTGTGTAPTPAAAAGRDTPLRPSAQRRRRLHHHPTAAA